MFMCINCLSLLGTQHRGGGFAINNIVYEDLDETSGPVTYDHYETAPDVPVSRITFKLYNTSFYMYVFIAAESICYF